MLETISDRETGNDAVYKQFEATSGRGRVGSESTFKDKIIGWPIFEFFFSAQLHHGDAAQMQNEERINKQLSYQLNFLTNSCRLYDDGHHEEALRIAVALENLIGQRKSATSIVRHLGRNDIKLYSSTGGLQNNQRDDIRHVKASGESDVIKEDDHILKIRNLKIVLGAQSGVTRADDLIDNVDRISLYCGLGVMAIGTNVNESSYSPYLGDLQNDKSSRLVTIREWLDEIVLIARRRFYVTRDELIGVARNQDGGGHVAPRLTGDKLKGAYRELSKDASIGYFIGNWFENCFGDNQKCSLRCTKADGA